MQNTRRPSTARVYRETCLDALNHLFGRNGYGRSFVTGVGFHPPLHPHDRRSGGDNVADPWPGYLVGGPHPRAGDWHDEQTDYRTNEIAINWNAALVYALAAFLETAN
jgi:endoglucanase